MSKVLLLVGVVLLTAMTMGLGCQPEDQRTDIAGWDLSACKEGWQTCGELFLDNFDHIQGGQTAVWNAMSPFQK